VAYYTLLSVFPLLLAAASIGAYFIDPQRIIQELTRIMGQFLPQGGSQIENIVQGAVDARGTASVLSILGFLWTGSRVFGVITRALNIAYDVDDTYGFIKRTALEVVMLGTVGIVFVMGFATSFVIGFLQTLVSLPSEDLLYRIVSEGLPVLTLLMGFFLAYRFVPRHRISWQASTAGAGLATVLFVVARPLFLYYLQRFARYNLIYGSLAIAVVLVVWAWIVAQILILGGEVASHTQAILIEGQSPRDLERRHLARSPVRQVLPDELLPEDETARESA
jgi:membrane protein